MTELLERIGHNVRRLREEKGWNQTELGYNAETSPSIISLIENGKRNPNTVTLAKIATALEVEPEALFAPKGPRRSSLEPSLLNGLEEERRPSVLAEAVIAAADTWLTAVTNPDINIHKRFGFRDAAIELFDQINERIIHGKLRTLDAEERSEIVSALGKLNEIPEAAYKAMPDETLKEANEERRKKIREWTRQISASA